MDAIFYFYANPFQPRSEEAARRLAEAIQEQGGRVLTEDWLSSRGVGESCAFEDIPGCVRALIAFGGDGTLLRAAPRAAEEKIPVLGVHTGTVGFLMRGNADRAAETAALLMKRQYTLEGYSMLDIRYEGETYLALNDLALTRGEHPGVIETIALADGEEVFCAHGDGAVLSTPQGATAYALSAGGPIVRHDASCLLLTPLCARELLLRPVVLPMSAKVVLKAHGRDRRRLQLAIDGQTLLPVTHEAQVEIQVSRQKFYMISLGEPAFFDTLRKKQAEWNQQE